MYHIVTKGRNRTDISVKKAYFYIRLLKVGEGSYSPAK
jgi:hypothetical protein